MSMDSQVLFILSTKEAALNLRPICKAQRHFVLSKNAQNETYIARIDKESPDYVLKCAFISMVNDESHKVSPFDSVYFEKIHKETPEKLFAMAEAIFDGNGIDAARLCPIMPL